MRVNHKQRWTTIPLSSLGKTYSGLTSKTKNDFGHGQPYITYKNVFNNTFTVLDEYDRVNVKNDETQNRIRKGDVLFTTSSETPDEVGMSSVVVQEPPEDMFLNSFCFGFRLTDDYEVNDFFLGYTFRSRDFRKKMHKLAKGTTRFNLSKADFIKQEIVLPSLINQKKVVAILSDADKAITLTEKYILTSKKLREGLMQELLTKGIGHTKFKDSELGKIPETWKVGSLFDYTNPEDRNAIKPGPFGSSLKKTFYVDSGFKVYGQEQVIKGDQKYGDYYIDEKKYEELFAFRVKPGDVLISLVGTLGKVLILDDSCEEGIINPRLIKISPSRVAADPKFIAYLLKSDLINRQLKSKSHGGTMSILNKGMLISVNLPIIPKSEQQQIVEVLEGVDEKIRINQRLKVEQEELKRGLMQDLLTGKVKV